jgi:hypothetical protein
MSVLSRRLFVGLAAATVGAGVLGRHFWGQNLSGLARASESGPKPAIPFSAFQGLGTARMGDFFLAWLRRDAVSRDRPVKNLVYNFYDTQKKTGSWLYPMLSGKAILWLLRRGLVDEANAIATTLLRWQETRRQGPLAKCYGAFTSKLEAKGGDFIQGERYYSGDNLVILDAFVSLYKKTKDPDLLNAAIGIGTWLAETMCKGREAGVWAEDHGAPMFFVTSAGNFANEIHTSEEMLWIGALRHLGEVTAEPAYARQALRAYEFLRRCQRANGAYFEAYDPGYPPKPYDAGRWKAYQAGQLIGDNTLRTALGACRMGDLDSARSFYRYLKVENGAVPAYLDLESGGHGFPPEARVYYDVTSSALHRSLCQWLGERAAAETDIAFLRTTQTSSGGWPWGIFKDTRQPVLPQLSPVVGFWATEDLSVTG